MTPFPADLDARDAAIEADCVPLDDRDTAIRPLGRVFQCEHIGPMRSQCLMNAAAALRRVGMPERAALAERCADAIGGATEQAIQTLYDELARR